MPVLRLWSLAFLSHFNVLRDCAIVVLEFPRLLETCSLCTFSGHAFRRRLVISSGQQPHLHPQCGSQVTGAAISATGLRKLLQGIQPTPWTVKDFQIFACCTPRYCKIQANWLVTILPCTTAEKLSMTNADDSASLTPQTPSEWRPGF